MNKTKKKERKERTEVSLLLKIPVENHLKFKTKNDILNEQDKPIYITLNERINMLIKSWIDKN